MTDLDGLLRVDKPEGPTSHDVVAAARRALGIRRIGHTGTLDPFASGLLILCVGSATRLSEYLTSLPKRYRATLRLGTATDTDDVTGEVISENAAWREIDESAVREALAAQVGEIMQLPPRYAAKKVAGERMYAAARRGEKVHRVAAPVTVYEITLAAFDPPDAELEVACSSGTYIRAIARDVGEALGVGAHLRALRRTAVGDYRVSDALGIDQLGDEETVRAALLAPAAGVSHLPSAVVDADEVSGIEHGRTVAAPEGIPADVPVAVLSSDGDLIAVAERRGDRLQPRKVFA